MCLSNRATSASVSRVNRAADGVLRNGNAFAQSAYKVSRVVIADEHGIVRDMLSRLFEGVPHVDVVADAADGHDTLHACRKHRPDIVVMEMQLPSLDGGDVIRAIRRRWPETRVLVLSANAAEIRAAEAFNAGAHGYVLKHSGSDTLLDAVNEVRAGRSYVDAALNVEQIDAMRKEPARTVAGIAKATLTKRERQVLKLIAEGGRNRDIAQRLTISQKTVETHRLNMMQKLEAHNIAELVKWAHRLGMTAL
jgi:two-component system secretion response regulator SsrB